MPPSKQQKTKKKEGAFRGPLGRGGGPFSWPLPPLAATRQQGHRRPTGSTLMTLTPARAGVSCGPASWAWSRSLPSYRSWRNPPPGGRSGASLRGYKPAPGAAVLSHRERRSGAACASPAVPSVFLSELRRRPRAASPRGGGVHPAGKQRLDRLNFGSSEDSQRGPSRWQRPQPRPMRCGGRGAGRTWAIGDQLRHASSATARSPTLFGSGEKISIAVPPDLRAGPRRSSTRAWTD